jgi:EAL domain-containing protein (putative c-di-GMP-specific phosphodiesterase class I)
MSLYRQLADFFQRAAGRPSDVQQCLLFSDGGVSGRFGKLNLASAFQPLLDARSLQQVGFEALLRARSDDGRTVSPEQVFKLPTDSDGIVFLDRLCRTLHAANFAAQAWPGDMLYLNVYGGHLLNVERGIHGQAFESLLGYCGLSPAQVVLEILESEIADDVKLVEAIEAYQSRGYRIAIDDFGCKHSNFDRLWKLSPDIVKLDRSLIVQSSDNSRARKILPKLVSILQDLGTKVVCEGIELSEQHQLAVDAGVDFVQGFLYARPHPLLHEQLVQESA